ncbi:MAG: riboflavin biosynthesis protein RibF [Clostridia bacterium]|nr:riboflavin biosynthesis protein RibF [Clostridia bacterium]
MIIRCADIKAPLTPCALALGTFDGVHIGHARVISEAASSAKKSGVAARVLTFPDLPGDFIETRARVPRIMSNALRERAIFACGAEEICYFDLKNGGFEYTAERFVEEVVLGKLNAKEVFCGFNFRFGRGGAAGADKLRALLEARGAKLTVIPPVELDGEPVSSSRIRRLIGDGDVENAARALGRPYSTDFPVEHGRRIGRSIGFPTINNSFPQGRLIPGFGVYATRALVDGVWRGAVTNVGTKPTVGGQEVTEETHIFGVDEDLYGRIVEVEYVARIRGEIYFESLDELREQITRDTAKAKEILSQR